MDIFNEIYNCQIIIKLFFTHNKKRAVRSDGLLIDYLIKVQIVLYMFIQYGE